MNNTPEPVKPDGTDEFFDSHWCCVKHGVYWHESVEECPKCKLEQAFRNFDLPELALTKQS